jgi:hypothetical protein
LNAKKAQLDRTKLMFWAMLGILVMLVCYVVFTALARKAAPGGAPIK